MIASFIYPSPAGAARYADRIIAAYEEHRRFSVRGAVADLGPRPGAPLALGQSLRRHGVDPAVASASLPASPAWSRSPSG